MRREKRFDICWENAKQYGVRWDENLVGVIWRKENAKHMGSLGDLPNIFFNIILWTLVWLRKGCFILLLVLSKVFYIFHLWSMGTLHVKLSCIYNGYSFSFIQVNFYNNLIQSKLNKYGDIISYFSISYATSELLLYVWLFHVENIPMHCLLKNCIPYWE